MTVLSIRYRYSGQYKPHYLKHADVEEVALEARAQLVSAEVDAVPFATLREVSALDINGLKFDLWVSVDHPVTDEQGETVLGLCEFDPGSGADAASLLVSPVGERMTIELALSTFTHELGHAVFDAPGWISASRTGPDLFDGLDQGTRKAYRTTTINSEHLTAVAATADADKPGVSFARHAELERANEQRIAEYRANEFMGSLLVPRHRLLRAAEALAPEYGVQVVRAPSLSPEIANGAPTLVPAGASGSAQMQNLQRELAARFGVNRSFIEVRMKCYGLLPNIRSR
ncbi:ImmA/IrrE family metallo-endopeptidase [Burkholderia pseudomallei]|uniref:ImmA/IrrE family metallo-endopeptidase n=1 Tax=Burkholderia pseudomallei TaxID=28450 RepID=UPI0018C84994|nr:hypothetical protein [Burkholderia pseudomallei]MBG1252646.1 hypothetical protein [Burkholderia pseudomallei]